MFYVNNVNLKYGDRELLSDVTFMLSRKDRAGLVGRNGAGKSTLFRIISNQQIPDEGSVEYPKTFDVGYLKQDLHFDGNSTVIEEAKSCFVEVQKLQHQLSELNTQLEQRSDYETESYQKLIEEFTDLNHRLDLLSVGNIEGKTEKVLKGLGFKDEDLSKKVSQFSGGWQMRIELAKLLLIQPELLLLDEPTNHLDIESIIWLEEYLKSYEGIVFIISHDKQFLNNVCNKIIDLELGNVSIYTGNFDKYIAEREVQREILQNSYNNQQKMLQQKERTISRFMAKATKTSMAQSMQKQLDKIERIEIPEEDTRQFKLNFGTAPRSGRVMLDVKDICKAYGEKEIIKNINLHIERGDKIAFVGQNGQGKTTLAKILVNQLMPTSGEVIQGTNVFMSYYAQNQAELIDLNKTIIQVMEDEASPEQRPKIRSILGAFLFSGEDQEKKVSVLSGGERARVAMAAMILKQANIIVMDEPTNHLDMHSKEVLKQALLDFDGTLIIVSHDREFLEGLSTKVYEFANKSIKEYLGDINYFLDKKKMDSIRDIETRKDVEITDKSKTAKPSTIDAEEQRKINRKIHNLEKEIEKLENEQKSLEEKLSNPEFYMNKEFDAVSKKYSDNKTKIDSLTAEWEILI